jgi:hypothetical protein
LHICLTSYVLSPVRLSSWFLRRRLTAWMRSFSSFMQPYTRPGLGHCAPPRQIRIMKLQPAIQATNPSADLIGRTVTSAACLANPALLKFSRLKCSPQHCKGRLLLVWRSYTRRQRPVLVHSGGPPAILDSFQLCRSQKGGV